MPFRVQRKTNGPWRVLYNGDDWRVAWDQYEKATESLLNGTARILKDRRVLREVTLPKAKRKRVMPTAPFRKIAKWVGPAATWVLLECGHHAHAQAAHRTRCRDCKGGTRALPER